MSLTSSTVANSFYIQSNVLAKSVFVSLYGTQVVWSDNYFDLIPNEQKLVSFQNGVGQNIDILSLSFMTLINAETQTSPNIVIGDPLLYFIE